MMTYHVAKVVDGRIRYLAGLGQGGQLILGDRELAMTFHQMSTATQFRDELNEREGGREWFRVEWSEDVS